MPPSGIAHKEVAPVTLYTPSNCDHCGKFIWGLHKQAETCTVCHKLYHSECVSKAGDNCVEVADPKTSKKEALPDTGQHQFTIHTYSHPTWCNVCNKFVWGFARQGYQCKLCALDAHKGCLAESKNINCLFLTSGGMALLKQLKSEPIIKKDITARRTQAGKATYATFSRAEQFKIKSRNNPLVQQFARASLIAIGSQVMSTIKSEDNLTSTSSSTLSSISTVTTSSDQLSDSASSSTITTTAVVTGASITAKAPEVQPEHEHEHEHEAETDSVVSSEGDAWQQEVKVLEDYVPPQVEDSINDYEITNQELGRGQFGVVKVAVNRKTNLKMAVKVIDKKKFWGRKPETARHMKREIAILSQLKHPNVIRLYGVFDEQSALLMFMELVEGGDLLNYVEQRGRISEDEGKFFFHQLAVGVKYLHDRGVVHRDLKPENLLLNVEDQAVRLKIADFGFANILGGKQFFKSVVGTPAYVAPEVLNRSSTGYTKAADLWSIGVMLYACLGGVFPFEDGDVEEQILAGKFNFPDEYFGNVSDLAIDFCCNLLVVDPKQRYTADDMLRHPWLHVTGPLALPHAK